VVYGERPLRGTAEFEVELVSYGTGWSGTLKLGVTRCKAGRKPSDKTIPRYSPEGTNHCVWSSDKLHNRLTDCFTEQHYGLVNLDELRAGDRLGMRVTHDGILEFFVNGAYQGIAAEGIYQRGYDIYAVVDHYANCKATKITRAAICVDIRLQDVCLRQIAAWLSSKTAIKRLPLPVNIQNQLRQHMA
jgi:neuralized-like protein 4